jgi:DNA-binding FadR family transcriptional regulator
MTMQKDANETKSATGNVAKKITEMIRRGELPEGTKFTSALRPSTVLVR